MRKMRLVWLAAASLALALGACSATQPESGGPNSRGRGGSGQGEYKVGLPYQVDGVWFYPREDLGYAATGLASWYGSEFNGRRTANGEIFNMNIVSAAHPTLPLPSIVRVTNLENGRAISVRVNDRGPFARGRIIDLSRRAAQLLGFELQGTARVRVEILPEESRQAALEAQGRTGQASDAAPPAVPVAPVTTQSLAPPGGLSAVPQAPAAPQQVAAAQPRDSLAAVDESVAVQPVAATGLYVQAGAFTQLLTALRLGASLSGLAPSKVIQVERGAVPLFRVRLGPVATAEEADRLLSEIIGAGHPDAMIVVE